MTRRLCIDMNWTYGPEDRRRYIEHAVVAEDAGVDTIFVAEAWGRDAFTTLTLLADTPEDLVAMTSARSPGN